MNNLGKRLSGLAAVLVFVLVGAAKCPGDEGGPAPISGGACKPIGSSYTDDKGQLWTCAKNVETGNGYWYKGKP